MRIGTDTMVLVAFTAVIAASGLAFMQGPCDTTKIDKEIRGWRINRERAENPAFQAALFRAAKEYLRLGASTPEGQEFYRRQKLEDLAIFRELRTEMARRSGMAGAQRLTDFRDRDIPRYVAWRRDRANDNENRLLAERQRILLNCRSVPPLPVGGPDVPQTTCRVDRDKYGQATTADELPADRYFVFESPWVSSSKRIYVRFIQLPSELLHEANDRIRDREEEPIYAGLYVKKTKGPLTLDAFCKYVKDRCDQDLYSPCQVRDRRR